jgi:hypothetical protein
MLVLVEDAAEAVVFSYVEAGDLVWIGIGLGRGCSGRVLAMPWCGRCAL